MAYKVQLEMFEGPLDLLLYLVKEEELDICNIPITRITEQYLEYINLMEMLDLDIAGDFLVMATTLLQIKSKMLLPPDPTADETEELDPRAELVRRLLEYKAFKDAAGELKAHEETRSHIFSRLGPGFELPAEEKYFVEVSLFDLVGAFAKVLQAIPKNLQHEIIKEEYSIAEKIDEIRIALKAGVRVAFSALFRRARNKPEAITIFLALLEIIKQREAHVHQSGHFSEIEIERRSDLASG